MLAAAVNEIDLSARQPLGENLWSAFGGETFAAEFRDLDGSSGDHTLQGIRNMFNFRELRHLVLHNGVVGNHRFIADHRTSTQDGVPTDVTAAAHDGAVGFRKRRNSRIRPNDRILDHGPLFDMDTRSEY